jgi:diamine N-acetyltransferase
MTLSLINKGEIMIKGKNVTLAPLEMEDIPLIVDWKNDRKLTHMMNSYIPITLMQEEALYSLEQEDYKTCRFLIEAEEDAAGYCGLAAIDRVSRRAELFIAIAEPDMQGKGYGKEALDLLIEFAFNDHNLNRLYLTCFTDNETAINLYKKSNFTIEGTLRNHTFCNGNYKDMLIMALLRSEWQQSL